MESFVEAVQAFFLQIYRDIQTFLELLLNGTGVVYGALLAVVFVIILALIMGYVLNNRQATPPKKVVIGILIVVVVFVLYTLFG